MSLTNPQLGNKTLMAIGLFFVFANGILAISFQTTVPSWLLSFAAHFLLLSGIILLLETWAEGKMPNIRKEIAPIIQTVLGLLTITFAVFIYAGIIIPTQALGMVSLAYGLNAFFIAREIIFD